MVETPGLASCPAPPGERVLDGVSAGLAPGTGHLLFEQVEIVEIHPRDLTRRELALLVLGLKIPKLIV